MKKKIKLNDLKVNSFVVTLEDDVLQTAKGGVPGKTHPWWNACRDSALCPHSEQALCSRHGGGCDTNHDCLVKEPGPVGF